MQLVEIKIKITKLCMTHFKIVFGLCHVILSMVKLTSKLHKLLLFMDRKI